jgi:hypothetical protein
MKSGEAYLFEVDSHSVKCDSLFLTKRNKYFNSHTNKTFDLCEIVHKSNDIILLFEKMTHKITKHTIFARLKFYKIENRNTILIQTIQENYFDSDLKCIYSCQDPQSEDGLPVFVTVHSSYSKVWKCEIDQKELKWKWINSFTYHRSNSLVQNLEIEKENDFIYSIYREEKSSILVLEKSNNEYDILYKNELHKKEPKNIFVVDDLLILVFNNHVSIRNKMDCNSIYEKSFEKVLFAQSIRDQNLMIICQVNGEIQIFKINKESSSLELSESYSKSIPNTMSSDNIHFMFDDESR